MRENVQAFDYCRDSKGILHFGIYDPETGTLKVEPVDQGISIGGGAINFLQKAWKEKTPKILAMDSFPLGNAKSFKRFLEGEGVTRRILNPADVIIRGVLERAWRKFMK